MILAIQLSAQVARASGPYVAAGHDLLLGTFNGTSSTAGLNQINLSGGTPGYFNNLTLPGGTATGAVTITAMPQGIETVVGVALDVTDTAGGSHSLSSLNDPALNDLVFALNHSGVGGDLAITTYAYNSAPAQYAGAESLLSAGESSLSGQPFDLLLVGTNFQQPISGRMYWSINLAPTVNTLDGITAIGMTDIGAVPEPSALAPLLATALLLARRRT